MTIDSGFFLKRRKSNTYAGLQAIYGSDICSYSLDRFRRHANHAAIDDNF